MKNPNRVAAKRRAAANDGETDTIIVFDTKNGSTLQYAKWLSSALQCDVIPYSRKMLGAVTYYNNVIYMSWVRNGEINRLMTLRQNYVHFNLDTKKVIIVAVGIAEPTERYLRQLQQDNWGELKSNSAGGESFYFLPGRFDKNRLHATERASLIGLSKTMLETDMTQEEADVFMDRVENGYNGMDIKAIDPIVEEINRSRGLV